MMSMMYQAYQNHMDLTSPWRTGAAAALRYLNLVPQGVSDKLFGRLAASLELISRSSLTYHRPAYGIDRVLVGNQELEVTEEVTFATPFGSLLHFKKENAPEQPRLLLVAPMSGHFATLLRGTVKTLLQDHDVYITDWQDAHHVPLSAGRFDLDDFIIYLSDLFRHFGGDVHVFAVCQPSVPVLAAVALMEENDDPNVPLSLILAGGPVDTRISPTVVNKLAEQRGTAWFRRNVITNVPWPKRGAGRSVYPGFLQLTGFMTMNLDRHVKAHKDLFFHLVRGDGDSAEKHREFYDEYLAVMDLTAEFFLQTIDTVFVRHALPKGEMVHRGRRVDLKAIRRVALMTIEGEKDDITGIGQCAAALDLCANIPAANKQHFECPEVGHYGIFNGSRFRKLIAPRIARFVHKYDPRDHVAREPADEDRQGGERATALHHDRLRATRRARKSGGEVRKRFPSTARWYSETT